MTKEEIIEMARQCGYKHPDAVGSCEDFAYFNLETFSKLVAAKEREKCAKLMDEMSVKDNLTNYYKVASNAIRAREQEK